jgi:ribonuclease HI
MKIRVYSDGGSRGNPGQSGSGFVVYDQTGKMIYEKANYWGVGTNNEAEYKGLLSGLKWILENKEKRGVEEVDFYMDSELIVKQMKGIYKVKAENLKELFWEGQELVRKIGKVNFSHVLREKNGRADMLANMAMDRKRDL